MQKCESDEHIPMLFIPKYERTSLCLRLPEKKYAVYVHIPFCEKKCKFCSIPTRQIGTAKIPDEYIKALLSEMRERDVSNLKIAGIHIGGGTPSILSDDQIWHLVNEIITIFGKENPEIVFESNPATLTKNKIDVLSGFDNLTLNMGVQTFDSKLLKEMNRFDDTAYITKVIDYAISKRMHVGVDLILGLPNSSLENSLEDIRIANELGAGNIFIYPYRCEKNSQLFSKLCETDIISAHAHMEVCLKRGEESMRKLGFKEKTIYYWTKEKKELYLYSKHQIEGKEWLGFGAGAFSYYDNCVLYTDCGISDYIEQNKKKRITVRRQTITSQLIWDITFLLKKSKIDFKVITGKYGEISNIYVKSIIEELTKREFLVFNDNICHLSEKGKVMIDDVEKIVREVIKG